MDEAPKKKILVLVEGEKTDVLLMDKIISSYPILDDYRIDWSHTGVTQEIDHLTVLQLQLALLEKRSRFMYCQPVVFSSPTIIRFF